MVALMPFDDPAPAVWSAVDLAIPEGHLAVKCPFCPQRAHSPSFILQAFSAAVTLRRFVVESNSIP